MAALDFPNSPSLNDQYSANGRTFEWNGEAWLPVSSTFINDGAFVYYDGPLNVGIGTTTPTTKFEVVGTITATQIDVTSATGITIDGNNVWHSGNDGAGSGLDADLLDGIQAANFLRSDVADTMAQGAVATATLTVQNTNGSGTGSGTGAVIAEFSGDSDALVIQNFNDGDYGIYNTQQNNGFNIYDGTGGVEILYNGGISFEADSDGNKFPRNVIIGSSSTPSVTLDVDGTDAVQLTVGTTAQRPTGAAGMIRYNSTLGIFEGFTTEWGEISGGIETQDDGVQILDNSPTLNFTGSGVTVSDGGAGVTNINIPDSGISSTTDVPEGSNLYFTNERVDDRVANLLVAGTNITITYDDGAGTLTIDAASGGGFDLSGNDITDIGDVSAAGLVDAGVLIYDLDTTTWRTFAISGDIAISDTGVATIQPLAGDLVPDTDNTGNVGTAALTWNDGHFTNFQVDNTLAVRGAIDLADSDALRFGSADDFRMFYDGVNNIMELELESAATALEITDNTTPIVTITKATGDVAATTFTGALVGNADTATALQTARNISLGGDLSGSASFDGTNNITINATVGNNSVALGTNTTGNYVATINGTANEIEVTGSGSETAAVTIGLPNNVTVSNDLTVGGNLVVNGTTTTVNSTTVTIDDPVFTLGGDTAPTIDDGNDKGIEFRYFDTVARIGFFGWDNSTNRFVALGQATNTSEVFSGTPLDAQFGTVFANVTGDITGNADTATALETARNIALGGDLGGSSSFDGTSNITINATIQPLSVETGMIANDAVTFAKIENVAADRILGRQGTSGNTQELTPLQAREVSISQRQVYVQEAAPSSPNAGDLWFDSDDATLYLYYQDTDSTQWVGISGPSGGGGGATSPFVDTGTFVYYGGPRNVGIGTATPGEALEVVGNILATQDVIAYSDERLKKNIQTIQGAVNTVKQLRGVSYRLKSNMSKSVGLIAQEVQEVLPDVVTETDNGMLAIAYGNLTGVLIEAVKEQQETIDSQETRIARLEEMVAQLMEK